MSTETQRKESLSAMELESKSHVNRNDSVASKKPEKKKTLGLDFDNLDSAPSESIMSPRVASSSSKRFLLSANKKEKGYFYFIEVLRDWACSKAILSFVDDFWVSQLILIVCTFWAIFNEDVAVLANAANDTVFPILIVNILIVSIFGLEYVVHIIFKRNFHLFSFYFWLDGLCLASLIPFIIESSLSYAFTQDMAAQGVVSVTRAGRIARTAGVLRVARFTRVLRAARLVRVIKFVNFFHIFQKKKLVQSSSESSTSAIGAAHAELVSKRVVVGVMLLLGIIPLLDVTTSDSSPTSGIAIVNSVALAVQQSNGNFSDALNVTVTDFISTHTPLVLNITGNTFVDNTAVLRTLSFDKINIIESPDAMSYAVLDISSDNYQVSLYSLLLTIFILLLFTIGSWIFNNDSQVMIITPLEQTISILKKLASQYFAANISNLDDNLGSNAGSKSGNIVDSYVDEIASAFHLDDNLGKIDDYKNVQSKESQSDDAGKKDKEKVVLDTFESVMNNKEAKELFAIFLKKELNYENLQFYDDSMHYKEKVKRLSARLYNSFIKAGAPAQVNISATQRRDVEKLIGQPDINTYAIAEAEIFKVMAKDPFPRFLKSDLIKTYEKNKELNPGKV